MLQETASEAQGFSVVQPGSSVATALSEGEAKKKHVLVLEVLGEQWRIVKRALETVRPFLYDQVVLADRVELDHEDSEVRSLTSQLGSYTACMWRLGFLS